MFSNAVDIHERVRTNIVMKDVSYIYVYLPVQNFSHPNFIHIISPYYVQRGALGARARTTGRWRKEDLSISRSGSRVFFLFFFSFIFGCLSRVSGILSHVCGYFKGPWAEAVLLPPLVPSL